MWYKTVVGGGGVMLYSIIKGMKLMATFGYDYLMFSCTVFSVKVPGLTLKSVHGVLHGILLNLSPDVI